MTWTNPQDDCMLCEMEKKTDWYVETEKAVIADTLGRDPHPFIVLKRHVEEPHDVEQAYMLGLVHGLFPDKEFRLEERMGLVPDHYHTHVVFDEYDVDLSDE